MEIDKNEIEQLIKDKIEYYGKEFGKSFKNAVLEIFSLEKLLIPAVEAKTEDKLIPLAKWNEHFEFPTVASLRQTYYNREKNGFGFCVEYGGDNGGRILINVRKYHVWRKSRTSKHLE